MGGSDIGRTIVAGILVGALVSSATNLALAAAAVAQDHASIAVAQLSVVCFVLQVTKPHF
jgi:hypothetical protein